MDPRERLRPRSGGLSCSVCGWPLTSEGMRVLAERDDLAFVELPCGGCGAEVLEMIELEPGPAPPRPVRPVVDTAPPIRTDDVRAMRRFLEGWQGDLRTLVGRRSDHGGRAAVEP